MRPAKETAWNLAVRNDICCKELFPGSDIVRSYIQNSCAQGAVCPFGKIEPYADGSFCRSRGEVCPFCRKAGLF